MLLVVLLQTKLYTLDNPANSCDVCGSNSSSKLGSSKIGNSARSRHREIGDESIHIDGRCEISRLVPEANNVEKFNSREQLLLTRTPLYMRMGKKTEKADRQQHTDEAGQYGVKEA